MILLLISLLISNFTIYLVVSSGVLHSETNSNCTEDIPKGKKFSNIGVQ